MAAGMTVRERSGRAGAAGRRTLVAGLIARAVCSPRAQARLRPPVRPRPDRATDRPPSVQATLVQLDGALRARGLVLQPTRTEIRPAEPPSFADVARWPFQALLPDDPGGGYFVVYAFATPTLRWPAASPWRHMSRAGRAGSSSRPTSGSCCARWDRRSSSTPWSPTSSPDPKTPDVAAALASVGTEVPIPPG